MSSHHHHATENIQFAFFLNLSFTLIEVIGGLWTNSLAILSDALHDLGDSIALGLSWYFARVSQKPPDERFSYGYKRFSLLGALISSLILVVGSTIILFTAIPRLFHPETVHVEGMLLLALLGVIVNGVAVLKLKGGKTQNERVVMLHLLEDTFGWIAVLIVGGVMWFVTLPVLDSLLSLGITFYILWHVFKNLHETVQVFLQAIPKNINIPELEKILLQQLPIHAIHDWRVWTLDGESNILSFHVIVADNLPNSEIIHLKKQIRYILREHDIQHPTIEIEYENEYCELAEDWGKGISQ